jgi:putative transposase
MPRTARIAPGGMVFHVLNRAIARISMFEKEQDFTAFERVVSETLRLRPMRICAYCVLPNHWHFLLWPERDGDLAAFMQRLTIAHVRNWQENRRVTGTGHLYQGRYKSFPVEEDEHFFTVARYVERNALRAGLSQRAEHWRWGSLWRRCGGQSKHPISLVAWPMPIPDNWVEWVNHSENENELKRLRTSVYRGRPYGRTAWQQLVTKQLGLESAYRPQGRPRTEKASIGERRN